MLRNYLKTAIRNLLRNRVYSFINVVGLSLGLACAMLIILYTKDELSYDRFHARAANIYRITTTWINPDGSMRGQSGHTGYFQGPRFTAGVPGIQSFVRMHSVDKDIRRGTEIVSKEMMSVDSNFFSVFSFPLVSGDPRTALLEPKSAVISEKMAIEQFGSKNAVGKVLMVKNDKEEFEPYAVTGVAEKCPQNSSIKFDILIPFVVPLQEEQRNENWLNYFLNTWVVLPSQANTKKVAEKMESVYEREAGESIKMAAEKYGDKARAVYALQPLKEMHLSKTFPADNGLTDASNPMYSYILSGIAFFILLIACINFVNLTVARSVKRSREIGIRKVVGGERGQLIVQFLGESLVLCFIAFALAIVLVQLVLPTFNQLSNKALALSYLFDFKLVAGYIVLFLVTGTLAGFYPAVVLSGFSPVQTLYTRFQLLGRNYLQKSLVVLQFTLATLLIVATITIYAQFNFLTTTDRGYDDQNIVGVSKWGLKHEETPLWRQELMTNPAVAGVTFKNSGRWGTIAKVNGETQIEFDYETIDEDYLPLYHIAVAKGRNFSRTFPSDSSHSVLVNEKFVQKAGWKDPIGQEVNFWYNNEKYSVVGVVKDYHYVPLNEEIRPQLFTMKPGNGYGVMYVKIKPGATTAGLSHVEKTFKRLAPTSPYSYQFKDQQDRKSYEAEEKWKQMMLFGAVLTIFISCIGLFGLSVLAAEKRTKEIGIRKVLGASVGGVVRILSVDFLKLVGIAMLIALPAAWYMTNRWLENYPYRISLSWWMFAVSATTVIVLALATVSFQAIKAAVGNPVKALRSE